MSISIYAPNRQGTRPGGEASKPSVLQKSKDVIES